MKNYTVKEIRTILYPIVSEILTPEFNAIYSSNAQKYSPCMAELMTTKTLETDEFVKALASCIGSISKTTDLVQSSPDQLLICFFMRYHLLTGYLANEQQDKTILLPETETDIFTYLLTEFYLTNLI